MNFSSAFRGSTIHLHQNGSPSFSLKSATPTPEHTQEPAGPAAIERAAGERTLNRFSHLCFVGGGVRITAQRENEYIFHAPEKYEYLADSP